jgi:hypothetical protein
MTDTFTTAHRERLANVSKELIRDSFGFGLTEEQGWALAEACAAALAELDRRGAEIERLTAALETMVVIAESDWNFKGAHPMRAAALEHARQALPPQPGAET